ncbi:MAG: molecular chaperone DnaK [Myxococcales bacterium]|nr:molecular chaperone DnaK [Myxococcales bacterium]|tara:strand:- start:512 stop:907 length:396 start_codon:yes stop_codon:yes gene_type:complete
MAAKQTQEKELTAKQRDELHKLLMSKRNELLEKLGARRTGTTEREQKPGDEADQAVEDAEVALETRLMDREAKLLREVERAVAKFKDETYGYCEGTDDPIGFARLKLRPWTRYSVTYKEELEKEAKRQAGG